MYSVGDEDEARALITATCVLGYDGIYRSAMLAEAQTLERLDLFSDELDRAHAALRAAGRCRCEGEDVHEDH